MKKSTLVAAFAAVALGASAQYNVNPNAQTVIDANPEGGILEAIVLDEGSIAAFKAANWQVGTNGMVNDVTTHFYVWDNTFTADESGYPGIDMHTYGYTSVNVGTIGWSGAGFAIDPGANFSTMSFSDDTHFHAGVRSANNIESVAFTILDTSKVPGASPAKVSVGSSAFVDNGATFPLVGSINAEGDWSGVDVKFSDLKKLYPSFSNGKSATWEGNVLSILAGGVAGKNVGLDGVYFYTPGVSGGVDGVAVDNNNAPVVYYNLQGVQVANPENGMYIKVQGNKVEKVAL